MTHHVKHDTIVVERVAYPEACELSSKRIEIITVKTLALSSSSKLPMLSIFALDAALQETMFFILLGVQGVIYIPHTLVPLKSLGLDSQSQETCSQAPCSFCALCSQACSDQTFS